MTTYNEIAGRRVNFLSSDPTYVDTNSNGQVWYNSSTATLKSWLPTGAWSAGGNLNTARYSLGPGGAGTQNAALVFGGYQGGNLTASEAYNGIAWTSTPSLNTARQVGVNFGLTQTAAICASGEAPPGSLTNQTESWNGTSWTVGNNIGTAVIGGQGIGSQTVGLSVGGQTGPGGQNSATEAYNGTSWTALPATLNTGRNSGGSAGISTAGLLFGGQAPATSAATESYNGTSWTTVGSLPAARRSGFAAGTQSSAIYGGGFTTANVVSTVTWNGTTWSASPANMTTARRGGGYATGAPSSAGLAAGGYDGSTGVANTEEWNFGVYSYTAAAWASGGNLNTTRGESPGGAGTQTAALMFGGGTPTVTTASESYNGSSWTNTPSMNTARNHIRGFGTQTAALGAGGGNATASLANVESYNGSWTSVNSMNQIGTGRFGSGSQTAAVAAGGANYPSLPTLTVTELWNGTSWTTSPANMNTGRNRGGVSSSGTQTASLAFGGTSPSPSFFSATESWNGTSWTSVNSMSNARSENGGFGTQTAAVAAGGNNALSSTEAWNGTAWSTYPSLPTSICQMGSCGTQSAGLTAGGSPGGPTYVNTTLEWTNETGTANAKTLTTS